jgi:hypothetical protein
MKNGGRGKKITLCRLILTHMGLRPPYALLMAEGKAKGRPRSALDTIIAAVAVASGCTVVTDNENDFAGVETINPLRGGR